jgi:spore germination protein GerM
MKTKLGGFVLLVALSSAVMMLGYTQYSPKPQRAARTEASPVVQVDREESPAPRRRTPVEVKRPDRPEVDTEARPSVKTEAASDVTLFVARVKGEDMQLVPVRQKVAEATPLAALKALAAYDGPEESVLPKGTKVLGLRVGNSGLAVADFSHEIVDNFPGGSRTEGLLLASIVDTLTQFRTISRVVITVGGKPVDSIGGHIDLEEPLTRAMLVSGGEE